MTKKIDNTTIGGRIKKRRNDLGLSQENLAEKLFTSKQMISVLTLMETTSLSASTTISNQK